MESSDADTRDEPVALVEETTVTEPPSPLDSVVRQAIAYEEILRNEPLELQIPSSGIEEGLSNEHLSGHHAPLQDHSNVSPLTEAASRTLHSGDEERRYSISAVSDDLDNGPDSASLHINQEEAAPAATKTEANDVPVSRKHWNPIWLSRVLLLAFAVLYGLLALALILLWYFSGKSHGFPLLTTDHYAWTYGPTAVLVIIVSTWRQVDFWCKSHLPWHELKRGDAQPDVSILLDYVSPILPTSFIKAIRFRHVPVITTVVGFILLKGITLASTGLLVSEATRMASTNVSLMVSTQFDGNLYNTNYDSTSGSVVDYTAYALMSEGLPYPDGLKSNVLYQSFADKNTPNQTNALISAEVDAFYPFFDCEKATVLVTGHFYDSGNPQGFANVSVQWSSCPESLQTPVQSTIRIRDPDYDTCPPRQLFGEANQTNCPSEPDAFWQLLTMADIRFNQTEVASSVFRTERRNQTGSWGLQFMPITAIICKSGYSIEQAKVTYDHSQSPPDISVVGPLTQTNAVLEGFNISNFAEAYTNDFEDVSLMLGNDITNELQLEEPDTFFGMMAKVANSNYETFLQNETEMAIAAKEVFNNLAIQSALYHVTDQNVSLPLQGSISQSEDRLHIAALPLWLMVAGLALMLVASIVAAISRPTNVAPCNIESISGMALIMVQSKDLQHILQDAGRLEMSSIQDLLSPYNFRAGSDIEPSKAGTFVVQALSKDGVPLADREQMLNGASRKHPTKWWTPIPLRWPLFVLISALPICLIVTLEVLQRLSNRNDGIMSTSSSGNIGTIIGTRFIPAFVMLVVATCYNSIDFNISLLAPFHKLRQGKHTARTTIMSSLMGKMPLHALYLAFARAHWAAVFSLLAALVGSVLTIVVSGLYTIEDTSGMQNLVLQRMDLFDPTWADSVSNDGGAAALTSDLEVLDVPYPPFTWADLAIPSVKLSTSSSNSVNGAGTRQSAMTVRLPVLRASLDCSVISESNYSVSFTDDVQGSDYGGLVVKGTAPLPSGCQLGGKAGDLSFIEWAIDIESLEYNSGWVGQMMDLHVGPWEGDYYSYDEINSTSQKSNPPGCPSLAFVFGNFNQSSDGYYDSTPSNFTPMICSQFMTEVDTVVTFMLPNLTITSATPDEGSVKYLNSGDKGETAFSYRPQVHLDLELLLWNAEAESYDPWATESPDLIENPVNIYGLMDPFFSAVLGGKQAVDPASLWGPENQDRLKDAIQAFYRRYMAQVASAVMRVSPGTTLETYTAKWQDQSIHRLKQNNASKIALQAMLGTMLVCGVVAYLMNGIRAVLPHNPCSIGGTASLLAGSELCGERLAALMPPGAEWMSDKELREHKVWDGWLFSMGWWDWRFGEQSRFGIDIGAAERMG